MEKFNLSKEVKELMDSARQFAENNNLKRINLETVLFTLIDKYLNNPDVESEVIKKVFGKLNADSKRKLRQECLDIMLEANKAETYDSNLSGYVNSENITLADNLSNVLDRSQEVLKQGLIHRAKDISSEVFFYSCLLEPCEITYLLDTKYRINPTALLTHGIMDMFRNQVEEILGIASPDSEKEMSLDRDEEDEEFEKAGERGAISTREIDPNSKTPTLDEFSLDMTKKALRGEYDPVIGRDKEISQVCEILCCRKKNNAILLGDPGAGKTAVVELLAQRIATGNVADELKHKRVLSLSTTDLTSGTMYRGQLEERVQKLCKELAENRDIILFIDEFQQATSESSSSIAQMLKPALGRGEITLIASTTVDEYRKFIEKDGALKRRFSPVQVEEPGIEETIKILEGIQEKYSCFHHVQYSDGLMKKIVEWSGKYINDRYFPDKAINILDMASSLCKLRKPVDNTKILKLEKQLESTKQKIKELVETCDKDKIAEAGELRKKENEIKGKIEKAKESLYLDPKKWPVVSEKEVSEVISKTSGIPVDKIMTSDMKKLKEIKTTLETKVIGQGEAVEQLTLSLQRNMLGLRDPKRPIASFMFLGPTGVGKALANGTPVLTDKGWVKIEDLKVGDMVATPYNGFSKISGVYPQGKKNTIYRFTFRDGRFIDSDENHLWQIRTVKQQSYFRKTTGENTRHSVILTSKDIYNNLKKGCKLPGSGKGFKYGIPLHEVYNNEKELEIHPYVLGVLLGDGCLSDIRMASKRILISSDEEDIIKKCSDILGCSYEMHGDKNYTNTLRGESLININQSLIKFNLNCKAEKKYIPEIYLHGSIEQRKDLLKGLIDTDGYIDNKGRFRLSTVSSTLKDNVIELCRSLGYMATVILDERPGRNTNYNIHIWTHDKIFSSKKREDQFNNRVKGNRTYWNDRLAITKVEKFDNTDIETTCIAIEDKDELFITKDYIVTHNTKISQVLAEEFFGSDKNLITIACSEYTQDFSESKLIGSSAGYVGYGDEPRLYALKRKPYSVLLIDEIEKASENLQNIFLNILEEGQVTLSSGEVVSCKNCIVIFTGNVGTKSLELYGKGMGFGISGDEKPGTRETSIVMKEVKNTFRPEFINRLSKIIVFNSLGKEEMDKIFYLELDELKKRLIENNGYELEVTDRIKDVVVSKCEPQYGARSLKRLLVEYVEQEICKAMLDQDTEGKKKILVDYEDEKVKVEFKESGE